MSLRLVRGFFTLLIILISLTFLLSPVSEGQETAAPTEAPTNTPIPSDTATAIPTETAVPTATVAPSETPTLVPSDTASPTETAIPTDTETPAPSETLVGTATETQEASQTPSETATSTATTTATAELTASPTPTATATRRGSRNSNNIQSENDLQPSTSWIDWYEETNTKIIFSPAGAWTLTSSPSASGSQYMNTTTLNATMSFSFYGRGFAILRQTNTNAGNIQVCVDALPCTTVSNTTGTTLWKQPFWVDNLELGVHQVTITNIQAKNFRPDAVYIYGDYVNYTAGSYEAETFGIHYYGTWNNTSATDASGGTRRNSVTSGSEFAFQFTGQQFSLVRQLAASGTYNNMEVCIDTACQTVTNTSGTNFPAGEQRRVSFGPYTEGTYTVTVRSLGALPITLDRIDVYNDINEVLQPSMDWYEEDHPYLNFGGGTWAWNSYANASGGASRASTAANNTLSFRFNGTGFGIKRETNSTRGTINVCIDGTAPENCQIVTNISASQIWESQYYFSNLTNAEHLVTITTVGAQLFTPDAIYVYGARNPLPVGNHEETSPDIHYSGNWTNQTNASASGGAYRQSAVTNNSIAFEFTGTHAMVYRSIGTSDLEVCVDGDCFNYSNPVANAWTSGLRVGPYAEGTHAVVIRSLSADPFYVDHIEVYSVDGTDICLDLRNFANNSNVEGANVMYPGLNMTTTGGGSVVGREGQSPQLFNTSNHGLRDGFADTGRQHDYTFNFSGMSVDAFTIWVLDYGDNSGGTSHSVTLSGYNAANTLIDQDTLQYGYSATLNDSTAHYGDPGNRLYAVSGENMTRLQMQFLVNNQAPNVAPQGTVDSLLGIASVCFDVSTDLAVQSANATYVENQAAVNVLSNATISANGNITSGTVTLTNLLNAGMETLAVNTAGTSISANWDGTTGILSLTGSDTAANYELVLESLTYVNSSQSPNETPRVLSILVQNNTGTSLPVTATVNVVDIPEVAMNTPTPITRPSCTVTVGSSDTAGMVTAINNANANPGQDTVICLTQSTYITTSVNNTVGGANAFPVIGANISIVGNGATIERASNAPAMRFFYINNVCGGEFALYDLTLRNGQTTQHGGAMYVNSRTLLVHVTADGNTGLDGGALYFTASASYSHITESSFTNNVGNSGGAVHIYSSTGTTKFRIEFSHFEGNHGNQNTGAIYQYTAPGANSELTLDSVTLIGNTAEGTGAIANIVSGTSTLRILNSLIDSNQASYSAGAVRVEGAGSNLQIVNTVFSNNVTNLYGSAVWANGLGTFQITNSLFLNNHATSTTTGATGAVYFYSTATSSISSNRFLLNQSPTAGAIGINSSSSTASISNNCFVGNQAQAAAGYAGGSLLNAENNWWGVSTGPNTTGADTASSTVDFMPFLTSAPTDCGLLSSPAPAPAWNPPALSNNCYQAIVLDLENANASYYEAEEPVMVLNGVSISGGFSQLSGATLTLLNIENPGDEWLSVIEAGNINAQYEPSTGVLTLTGYDTRSHYEDVISSLTYENRSQNPNTDEREINILVSDGISEDVGLATVKVVDIPQVAMNTPVPIERPACTITVGAEDTQGLVNAITAANSVPYVNHVICLTESVYLVETVNNTNNGANAFPVTNANISIIGNGATIERAANATAMRFFYVNNTCGGEFALYDLTLRNGSISSGNGGAIYANTRTRLVNVTADGNTAQHGGAIFLNSNANYSQITQSSLINNTADGGSGGAIYTSGVLRIDFSHIEGNSATSDGGAIMAARSLIVSDTSIIGNDAPSGAGIAFTIGGTNVMTLVNSSLIGNTGEALYTSGGTVNIQNSLFYNNQANNISAITHVGTTISISNSHFVMNTANQATIYQNKGTLNIQSSTIEYNITASGAAAYYGTGTASAVINNSCIVNNSSGSGGGGNDVSLIQSSTLNAENNWWGAATGPNTAGADRAYGAVDFTPFLTSVPSDCGLLASPAPAPAWNPPALSNTCYQALGMTLTGTGATFVEGGAAVDTVSSTSITGSFVSSATISITNMTDIENELLTVNTTGTNIVPSWNGTTGVLSLTGNDTPAHYQQVINSLFYSNSSENPGTVQRQISVMLSDGTSSASKSITVNVTAVNDAPELSGTATSYAYIEGSEALLLVSSLNISDVDSTEITSATITLTNLLDAGSETLSLDTAFASSVGIDVDSSVAGILSLSGTATLAEYQAVLLGLRYQNSSLNLNETARVVEIVVSDGEDDSNILSISFNLADIPQVQMNTAGSITLPECSVTVPAGDTAGLVTAINNANATPYAETVICLTQSSYLVNSVDNSTDGANAFPVIGTNITIVGNNAIIEREETAPEMRFFMVDNSCGGEVAFYDLTLRNGAITGDGGAIYAKSRLLIANLSAENNLASGDGGAVYLASTAAYSHIMDSNFSNNQANNGGALAILADATEIRLDTSNFNANTATAQGGAVYIGSDTLSLVMDSLSMTENQANSGGAISNALWGTGDIHLYNSFLAENSASQAGGAFYTIAASPIEIFNTAFVKNTAVYGAAFAQPQGFATGESITIENSLFLGNIATGTSSEAPASSGAAIYTYYAGMEISLSTIEYNQGQEDNRALASTAVSGNNSISNSCIYGNGSNAVGEIWDAENNWWGVATGPNTVGADGVDSQSDYEPFLTSSPACGLSATAVSVPAWAAPSPSNSCTTPFVVESADATYTEDGEPVNLIASASFAEVNISSVEISLTNLLDEGEEFLDVSDEISGLSGEYDPETGILTLLGTGTAADYELLLESLSYENLSQNPSTTERNLTIVFHYDGVSSPEIPLSFSVEALNDAPTIEGTGNSQVYFESDAPMPVYESLLVEDLDSENLSSASISLTNSLNAEEAISIDRDMADSMDVELDESVAGTISISGSASVEDYLALLETLVYTNTATAIDLSPRIIELSVSDGELESNVLSVTINLAGIPSLSMNVATPITPPECDTTIAASDTVGLIEAINDANVTPYLNTVICLTESTYSVIEVNNETHGATAFPVLNSNITIVGNNATIERDASAPEMRFFAVENLCGGEVSFMDLVLRNGAIAGNGGAIYANSRVLLVNITAEANIASSPVAGETGYGGAVYLDEGANYSRISASHFNNNQAINGGALAIHAGEAASLRLEMSSFEANTAENGGAIYIGASLNELNLVLDSLYLMQNHASFGGAIYNTHEGLGTVHILNTWFNANDAESGAGYYDNLSVMEKTFENTLFSSNTASEYGGAIATYSATEISISSSYFINNGAGLQGGTIYGAGSNFSIDAVAFELNRGLNSAYENNLNSTISNSCFVGNAEITLAAELLSAENNWWGVETGPNTEGGATVSGDVDFDPWLIVAPVCELSSTALAAPEWNPPAVSNDCPLNVTDPDDAFIEDSEPLLIIEEAEIATLTTVIDGLSISISNLLNGEDEVLDVTIPEGLEISKDYDDEEGVLTLEGSATWEEYLTILQTLSYINYSDTPNTEDRTIEIRVLESETVAASVSLGVIPVNDPPELNLSSPALIYTEGNAALNLVTGAEITDPDGTMFTSMMVELSNPINGGAEVISLTASGGLTADYNPANSTWTVTGEANAAAYSQVLQSLTYVNNSQDPDTTNRLIKVIIHDAEHPSFVEIISVAVVAVNDALVLDLNGAAEGVNSSSSSLNNQPVDIVGEVIISDLDSNQLSAITVEFLGNGYANEYLWISANPSLVIQVQATETGLRLSGTASFAEYQAVLGNLYYQNRRAIPEGGQRQVQILAWQGTGVSAVATAIISFETENLAPIIDLDTNEEGSNSTSKFVVGTGAVPLVGTVFVDDDDSANLVSARIEIAPTAFDVGMEVLSVNTAGTAIIARQDGRVLSLSGLDTVAHYQQVIQSLTYLNRDNEPNMANRIISIRVNDGFVDSNIATSTVVISPSRALNGFVCIHWDLTGASGWADSPVGSITWDETGMYAEASGTVSASYQLPDAGPWQIYIDSSTSQYQLWAGTSSTDRDLVPRDEAGFFVTEGAYVELSWNYVGEADPVFSDFCYRRVDAIDLAAVYLDTTALMVDFDTLEVSGSLSANIENTGTVAINESFAVVFFDDVNGNDDYDEGIDTKLAETEVASLAEDATITVTAEAQGTIEFVGDRIYVYVDSSESITEVDESNNLYWAHCYPDLSSDYVDTTALVIDYGTLEVAGSLSANVQNRGSFAIESSFDVIFFDDVNNNYRYDEGIDTVLGEAEVTAIAAGESITVTADAEGTLQLAGDRIYVYVDSSDKITEFDEWNNLAWAQALPE